MRARGYVKQLMGEAGLTVREDTMGNIYGVLPGANPGAAAVGTGSHCDAIPLAGAYDGTLGAAAGWGACWAGCLRSWLAPAHCLASSKGMLGATQPLQSHLPACLPACLPLLTPPCPQA